MAGRIIVDDGNRLLDASGNPIGGGKVRAYRAGTSTPEPVYTTAALTTAHADPLVADSGGYVAQMWADEKNSLDVKIFAASDTTYTTPLRQFLNVSALSNPGLTADCRLDPEQTAITARGTIIRDRYVSGSPHYASVEAGVVAFELRFRQQAGGTWYRKRLADGPDLRLPGDNDLANLQAIADYNALWFGNVPVQAGRLTIADSLFVTHGVTSFYATGRLVGTGRNPDGGTGFAGTAIVTTATDRPALIVQGGRHTYIADLTVAGPLYAHIYNSNLGNVGVAVDDTVHTAWDTGSILDKQWAPLVGIVVDPLFGSAPATPYPSLPVPAYLGPATQQYGRETSSDTLIERVTILGFNTGIAVHPATGQDQSDYVHGRAITITACKYEVSIGNTQSRLPTADHRTIARVYCGFTNRLHGDQSGFMHGVETNVEVGACIKIFDFNPGKLGMFGFHALHAENCWMLGELTGGTSVDAVLSIRQAHVDLSYPSNNYVPRRGIPPYVVGNPASTTGYEGTGGLHLATSLILFRTICPLMVRNLALDDVILYSIATSGSATLARALAHNGSLGLVMPPGARPDPAIVSGPRFTLAATPANGTSIRTDDNFRLTSRVEGIPWFVRKATPKNHKDSRYAVDVPLHQIGLTKEAFADLKPPPPPPAPDPLARDYTVSGKEITFKAVFVSAEYANNHAQAPGCLVFDYHDGRWYYIKSRTYGTGGVLEALTDYHDVGAGDVLRTAFSPTGGAWMFFELASTRRPMC